MMQFLEFTFQSFWHFLGVLIILSVFADMITKLFRRK